MPRLLRSHTLRALGALSLLIGALAACTGGSSTSTAPGPFPAVNPGGVPHAQYVVVANVITPSILTFNLGTNSTPSSGNLTPAYNNTSATLSQPFFIFNDHQSNLWAANFSGSSLTWYSLSATGGSPTSHNISGSNTTLACPTGTYISQNGTIYVSDPCSTHGSPSIDVFAPGSSGNVAPSAWIGGGSTGLGFVQGLIADSTGHLWVIDTSGVDVAEFGAIALGSGQNNVAPLGMLTSTAMSEPDEIAMDEQQHLWVGDLHGGTPALFEFDAAGGAQNTPLCTISGANTGLTSSGGQVSVAVDNGGYVYAVDATTAQIDVFGKGQCGNVAPTYTISGASTGLTHPAAILVYSTGNDY